MAAAGSHNAKQKNGVSHHVAASARARSRCKGPLSPLTFLATFAKSVMKNMPDACSPKMAGRTFSQLRHAIANASISPATAAADLVFFFFEGGKEGGKGEEQEAGGA
jgi:hypothetical protein